ncbi:MAG: peptidase C39 family protein [Candidatus Micrarchaeia archaeon]
MAQVENASKKIKNKNSDIKDAKPKNKKIAKSKIFEIQNYAQSEEFTSAGACGVMVLKYLNKNFQPKKDSEFEIWQDAVRGSIWHGSRYGIAYALAKRGAKPMIFSNITDEGYEKQIAVDEGINLDTLLSSFREVKEKVKEMKIPEKKVKITIKKIKEEINHGNIPILLMNLNSIDPYLESSPHWIVVKGYDDDSIYINDPYSDNTIAMDPSNFSKGIGYKGEMHMICVRARK